jgi:hypothetical protein
MTVEKRRMTMPAPARVLKGWVCFSMTNAVMNRAIMTNARWVDGEKPENTRYRPRGIRVSSPAVFRALAVTIHPGNSHRTR